MVATPYWVLLRTETMLVVPQLMIYHEVTYSRGYRTCYSWMRLEISERKPETSTKKGKSRLFNEEVSL
jgi:hypothetical protein